MRMTPDELVQQFLDGYLEKHEEADALRQIAENPEARALLRCERRVQQVLSEDHAAAPPDFTDRVMEAVAHAEAADRAAVRWQRIRFAWHALVRPRPVLWRPAYALPLMALLIGLIVVLGQADLTLDEPGGTPVVSAAEERPVLVRFQFVDEQAGSVAVAGDFNYWEPRPLERHVVDGRVVWTAVMAVPSGEHRYMFVVDGEEWVTDPLAPEIRDDGFGKANAILSL